MKPLILTLLTLLCGVSSNAQHWTELNPPKSFFNNTIFATAADASGRVYAAGGGTDSAGENAVAVLENGSWKELGVSTSKLHAKGTVYALTLDPSGNLYAAGMFTDNSGQVYVAKWNGNSWSETGPSTSAQNFTGLVFSLTSDKSGNIYAAGEMIDSQGYYYVSKFDGTQWQPLGKGVQSLHANGIFYSVAADANGNVYAAGQFTNASGKYYVAKWNGNSWSELGTGATALNANDAISQIQVDASGNVYAAGYFKNASGHPYVAKWNGSSWSELGTGPSALQPREGIIAMHIDKNNHLYVGCQLVNDTTGARYISQWNGSNWTKIEETPGFYLNNIILSITSDAGGNLYTAGNFTDSWNERFVAKYGAGFWSQPGYIGGRMPEQSNPMKAMATDTGGHVFVVLGNYHPTEQSDVVRWNGIGWDALPTMDSGYYNIISRFAPDSLGNIYAMGNFHSTSALAKWNGTNWTPIPFSSGVTGNFLNAIATDKKGNVYLAGTFNNNGLLENIAKWDGNEWTMFYANADVVNMVVDPNNDIIYATTNTYPNYGYNVMKIENQVSTDIGMTTLQPYGVNFTNRLECLTLDGQGNVYSGGSLFDSSGNAYIAKWDGTTWSHLEKDTNRFNATGQISSMAFDKNGNLFAGGNLMQHSGTYIGMWDGYKWQTVGDAVEFWYQQTTGYMARDGKGNVYADLENHVYRYTGDQTNAAPPSCNQQYRIQLTVSKPTISGTISSVDVVPTGMPHDAGTSYTIEFATDRDFTQHLQSTNNIDKLTLSASDLQTGQNLIFGRMFVTDQCGNNYVSIDSVIVTKTVDGSLNGAANGIVDPDFPSTLIGTYPNPVENQIHVGGLSETKSYTIEVYNNQGNKITQLGVSGQTDAYLGASSLEPGIYMVQVYDNTKGRRIGVIRVVKRPN